MADDGLGNPLVFIFSVHSHDFQSNAESANQISIWPKRENSLKGGSSTQERRTIRQKFPFASQAIPGKQKIF